MLTGWQDTETPDFELLPAIDLRGGRVVRLAQGDFRRETVYDDDPGNVAGRLRQAGVRCLHVVDLDGARDGARRQVAAMREVVAAAGPRVACEVAGGFRDEESVAAALDVGAARVVLGTAALDDPDLVGRLVARHGPARIAVALDVRDGLAIGRGWVRGASGVPAADALSRLADRGVKTFVVTAIERDGLLAGPDLALLSDIVALGRGRVIASGGISLLEDLASVRRIGCVGAIVGRAIYEGRVDLTAALRLVRGRGE